MSQIVDRRNLDFLLYEVLDLGKILASPRYADHDRESVAAVLDTVQSIGENEFLSFATKLDAHEPHFVDGKVSIIPEVEAALRTCADAGLFGASFDQSVNGLQLPFMVTSCISSILTCANLGVANYMFLTVANAHLLDAYGTKEQKALFLPPMLEGRWFGTMCLSEPQAGSSLGDIRTRAEPVDGRLHKITGTKMWISGGDHEISDNIVHLVLARRPDGPPGVKGISLFIVPKHRVNEDGSLGESNNIALAGLNHKMGQRGTTNCLLNFGENGDTYGYLVGEPNQGLRYMFHMMNEARIGVGAAAAVLGLAGYLYSLDYARSRPQGRRIGNKDPLSPQLPIIEHVDVRRMLLEQKSSVEGAIALCTYCAMLVDEKKLAENDQDIADIDLLLELLTPAVKSWPSEHCLEANKWAIQILGGYGYTRDYPVERFYRDNRLNHIHEGAFAIHGMDLLGRKVHLGGGRSMHLLLDRIGETVEAAGSGPFATEVERLNAAISALLQATNAAASCANRELGLANATLYLDAFGTVVIAWLWLKQAAVAHQASAGSAGADKDFYAGKVAACRYFFRYKLPSVFNNFSLVEGLDDTCLVMPDAAFG